jgi:1-deoxy-D-xylulose-5-phosphate reductoisomerase
MGKNSERRRTGASRAALGYGTVAPAFLFLQGPGADVPIDSPAAGCRRIVVLGSTGSIGQSTLDVVDHLNGRLEIVGLSAHSRRELFEEQVERYRPRLIALTDPESADYFASRALPSGTELLRGPDAIARLVTAPEVDVVVTAIVGSAGLRGTWHALEAGKTVAVANKETLVMAGPLVMDLAARKQATVLPVDSEHSAIFQAMQSGRRNEVSRVVLTASGGPFRGKKRAELDDVTAEEALRHPTWKMGPKITVDSATLMNKALEIIEARWLFDLRPEQIEVVIHPESIVHSFVEFTDGSVLAQLSPPDMRLPIQYALTYPERVPGPAKKLDWHRLRSLTFEQPDRETFPALDLGFEVARRGGTSGAVLNAANEAAVGEFLAGRLRFLDIPRVCRAILDHHPFSDRPSLEELHDLDRWARQEVVRWNTKKALPVGR